MNRADKTKAPIIVKAHTHCFGLGKRPIATASLEGREYAELYSSRFEKTLTFESKSPLESICFTQTFGQISGDNLIYTYHPQDKDSAFKSISIYGAKHTINAEVDAEKQVTISHNFWQYSKTPIIVSSESEKEPKIVRKNTFISLLFGEYTLHTEHESHDCKELVFAMLLLTFAKKKFDV